MPTFQILAKTLKRTKLRLACTFPCTSCIFVHPNLTMVLQHYEKQKQETEKKIGLYRNWNISHVVASFVTTYIILYNWWSEFACDYQKHSIPKHLSIDTVTMLLHVNMCHIYCHLFAYFKHLTFPKYMGTYKVKIRMTIFKGWICIGCPSVKTRKINKKKIITRSSSKHC